MFRLYSSSDSVSESTTTLHRLFGPSTHSRAEAVCAAAMLQLSNPPSRRSRQVRPVARTSRAASSARTRRLRMPTDWSHVQLPTQHRLTSRRSQRDVDRRVGDFLRDAALRAAPGRCALVAHGSSLRSLARQVQSDAGPWVHGELSVASWAFSRQGGQRQHVPGRRRLRGRVNES